MGFIAFLQLSVINSFRLSLYQLISSEPALLAGQRLLRWKCDLCNWSHHKSTDTGDVIEFFSIEFWFYW